MTAELATVIAAVITALASAVVAIISKYELTDFFRRPKFNLSGEWQGLSVYMPIDIFNVGSECVYKFTARIKQTGGKIAFEETIVEFFDIEMNTIDKHPPRIIKGDGKVLGDRDVIIQFKESDSLTCGTMYLVVNTWGKELQGIIAVRNPYFGTPAGVKIVLRRVGEKAVTGEELGLQQVKAMADAFIRLNPKNNPTSNIALQGTLRDKAAQRP